MDHPCQAENSTQTNEVVQNNTDQSLLEACQKLKHVCVTPRNAILKCLREDQRDGNACLNNSNNNYCPNSIYPSRRMHRNFYDSWQNRNNSNQIEKHLTWNDDDCGTSQSNRMRASRTPKYFDVIGEKRPKNSTVPFKNKPLQNYPRIKLKKVLVSNKKYQRNDKTDNVNTGNQRVGYVSKCYCNNDNISACKHCSSYLNDDLYSDKSFRVSRLHQEYEQLNRKYDKIAISSSEESLEDPLTEYNDNPLLMIDAADLENIRDFRSKYFFECHSAKTKLNSEVNVLSEPHKRCQHEFYLNDNDEVVPANKDHQNNSRCFQCYLPLNKTISKGNFSGVEGKTSNYKNSQNGQFSRSCNRNSISSRKFIRHIIHSDSSLSETSDDDQKEPEMFVKIPVTEDMLISDRKYCLKNYKGNRMRRIRLQACDNSCLAKRRK